MPGWGVDAVDMVACWVRYIMEEQELKAAAMVAGETVALVGLGLVGRRNG